MKNKNVIETLNRGVLKPEYISELVIVSRTDHKLLSKNKKGKENPDQVTVHRLEAIMTNGNKYGIMEHADLAQVLQTREYLSYILVNGAPRPSLKNRLLSLFKRKK